MTRPVDAEVRERALDAGQSFIVQAPAGSGKTELLTRRVLTLLATVDEPENVLAITFTRKAAKEMRDRVVATLARAADASADEISAHEAEGIALASIVLERDRARDWQLLRNPSRLNLRTIDSLATQLATRLPVMSALGAPSGVVDDAVALYREAATRFLDENLSALDLLLLQLGNRLDRAQVLLADLLARRDQWKRYVYADVDSHEELRVALEGMLAELVESRLDALLDAAPHALATDLPRLIRQSAIFRSALADAAPEGKIGHEWDELRTLDALPASESEQLQTWQRIHAALLTQKGVLRRKLTRSEGCPISKADAEILDVSVDALKAHKADWLRLLEHIGDSRDSERFIGLLHEVATLPVPRYDEDQWVLLSQLMQVLPALLLELQLVFAERRRVDFVEMAERAERALGTDDDPTDLALAMDLRLRHVLVDEFQDTSRTQFALFERLVAEWSPGDGRTFFAVGDPMQSIYRFRDGDVALFGQAQRHGIGPVHLESLVLQTSFRAAPLVVDWINDTFAAVFPEEADATTAAVPYSPSTAFLDTSGDVHVHAFVDSPVDAEANAVAELATLAGAADPAHSVAILLRSRTLAPPIFTALRKAGVPYRAIDMDLLGERAVVRDLLSLCLAFRYPHDRLHWLAVLRSPLVGLTLSDLHVLMHDSHGETVLDLLSDTSRRGSMSLDGQRRVARMLEVVEPAVKRAQRAPVVPWVESCWLQLGGPIVCRDESDLDAAERCLVRLQSLEVEGQLYQRAVVSSAMGQLYASSSEARVQVMTLHKAKGLEFDTVILPSVDRGARSDDARLLDWFESTVDGDARLLLAPIEERGRPAKARHGINRLVHDARKRCDRQESLRLLYVACTRAKRHLHVLARGRVNAAGDVAAPRADSLLSPLWPRLEGDFVAAAARGCSLVNTSDQTADLPAETCKTADLFADESTVLARLERLPHDWRPPQLPRYQADTVESSSTIDETSSSDTQPVISWVAGVSRDIGTVVHRQLQRLAAQTVPATDLGDVVTGSATMGIDVAERGRALLDSGELAEVANRQLCDLGVPERYLNDAGERVMRAIGSTLDDERGRWILSAHTDARSEFAVTTAQRDTGDLVSIIIDRTFVDEQGVRWIIDFKTADHEGGERERFLDQEQDRYRHQLERYADIISRLDSRPIRVGLYFPMLKGWREWQPAVSAV